MTAVRPARKISLSRREDHSRGALSYLDMGKADNPCIVFIHGFGADLLTWYLCLVPLASSSRVIALDLPGHGQSTFEIGDASLDFMRDWFNEAMDLLGVRVAHIVAHSMGAKIAIAYGLSHPERVLSLGLVAPAGLGGHADHDALNVFLDAPSPESAQRFARHLTGPASDNLIPAMSRSLLESLSNPQRHAALRRLLGRDGGRELSYFQTNATFVGEDLNRLRCPVLVVHGEHDRVVPLPDERVLPRHSQIRHIAGIGHLPHMEAPQAVVSALRTFLAGTV